MYPPPPTGTPVLQILTLNPSTIAEGSITGVVVGSVAGKTAGSVLSLSDDAGGRFAVSGGNQIVAGATATDYEAFTSHNITILETLAGATGNPKPTTITITVSDVNPDPTISSTNATQTNAPGTAPYSFTVAMGSDIYPGFYLDIERSTTGTKNADGSYVANVTGFPIAHQLTVQERADDYITTQALIDDGWVAPSGQFWEQYRWRREDGAAGPRTEITDTVAASTALLTAATGTSKNAQVTVSGSPALRFLGNSGVGSPQPVRATIQAQANKTQMELTIAVIGGSFPVYIGYDDGTTNFNSGFPAPGTTNSLGYSIRTLSALVQLEWNSNANSFIFSNTAGVVAAGDVFSYVLEKSTGSISVYRTRSGTTVQIGSTKTGLPALGAYYSFAAPTTGQDGTFNYGATAFSRALGGGEVLYG